METSLPSTPDVPLNSGITAPFSVTESAARRIAKITVGEPEGSRFRIAIKGGGCSGFQYLFDFDAQPPGADDTIIEKDGAFVIIDEMSLGMLAGSTLDYIETLGSAGFEIRTQCDRQLRLRQQFFRLSAASTVPARAAHRRED